jgi:ribosomal protein S18 acetylase RimI-like enzyme
MMSGVTIRPASDEDFAPLCALYCQSVRCNPNGFIQDLNYHGCLIAKTRAWRQHGGDMLVARENDAVIAMGGLAPEGGRGVELCKLHVDAAWQGRGLGRLLTQQLIELAGVRGFTELKLHVTTTQQPAINLYLSIGFQPVDKAVFQTTVFGRPAAFDTLHMSLPINPDRPIAGIG